jgi:hypothetical protein
MYSLTDSFFKIGLKETYNSFDLYFTSEVEKEANYEDAIKKAWLDAFVGMKIDLALLKVYNSARVQFIMIKGKQSTGRTLYLASKICARAGEEFQIPAGQSIPDEMIDSNSRFPQGYDKSGKFYFDQHTEYSTNPKYQELHKKYPQGVTFDELGFPNLEAEAIRYNGKPVIVEVDGLVGDNYNDFKNATRKAKELGLVPANYEYNLNPDQTWHHYQDGRKMVLVSKELHQGVSHDGGASRIRSYLETLKKSCK